MLDSKFFTFLKPKNDFLVQFWTHSFFRAEGPEKKKDHKIFFGDFLKKSAGGYPPHGIGNRPEPRVWCRSPGGTPLSPPAQTLFGSLRGYPMGRAPLRVGRAVFGIVAETQGRPPPGGSGRHANPPTLADPLISGTLLTQNGQKNDFSGGKKWSKKWPKNDPKMVQKWSKNGQKSDGGAQKNPQKSPKIEKMAKNGPHRAPRNCTKMH